MLECQSVKAVLTEDSAGLTINGQASQSGNVSAVLSEDSIGLSACVGINFDLPTDLIEQPSLGAHYA
jgi:hypothetical protein